MPYVIFDFCLFGGQLLVIIFDICLFSKQLLRYR